MSTRDSKVLHDACGKGQLRAVKGILEKGGDVVSLLDSHFGFLGYTPLHAAACHGHDDILSLLLIYGGNVNTIANGNYTPLHISASMGYVRCIEVLLKNNADIRALDDFHKTPYQTAVQHKHKDSAKTLKSAEIIQAAKDNSQELRDLLNETATKDTTMACFNDALLEASHVGNFDAVCMLLVTGATNIKECIGQSIKRGHYRVTALLLICYAAFEENICVLENLLEGNLEHAEFLEEFVNKSLPKETVVGKIRDCLKSNVEQYTRVAIQLLAETKSVDVLKVLLLSTSCRKDSRKVNWSRLSLVEIHQSWIDAIMGWVQELDLSGNKLTSLPKGFMHLKLVVRLDLSANKLKTVPDHIFSLVCLRILDISGNAINELPEILELRPTLKSLNLSDNNLSTLPLSMSRSCLETLNLCRNNFTKVPLTVCEITSLKYLDLSDNREINYFPVEMGKLRNLTHLEQKNLEQITDPPEKMRQNAQDLVSNLRRRLRACEPYYKMKLMLVGKGGHGKTTLVHRLQEDYTYRGDDLTQGVEISDLIIKKGSFHKEFVFKVWDFGGQEDYYATHQCFLSTMSLYLLVWRLIDGEEGVNGLTPWLDNIAVRSPGSTVIIVGTYLDCISPEKYGTNYVDHMKNMVNALVMKPRYKDKVLVPTQGVVAVSCAFGIRRADISSLRYLIYDAAAALKKERGPVMGEQIPFSFFSLIERIEKRKMEMLSKKQPPIMRREEFHAMVNENSQLCKKDVQDPHDVRDATVFLRERGIVMHFDDPNEGLNDLYFIDPRWLCALMARVVTVKCHADLVKEGVLEIEKTKVLFKGDDLPFDFYAQYLRLLVRFQIAYLLDESRILVPSKLPEKQPEEIERLLLPFAPVRRVYKIDYQRIHGFWPRFISRFFFYMKEMIAVDSSRYQKSGDGTRGFLAKFCRSCVRVETSSSKFPCILDNKQWEACDEPEKTIEEDESTNAPKSPPKPRSRPACNKNSTGARHEKRDDTEYDLQALFLDPTVRLFTEEELDGGGGNDEIDSMIVNNVTTYFSSKKKGSCSNRDRQRKSKKKPASTPRNIPTSADDEKCQATDQNIPTANAHHREDNEEKEMSGMEIPRGETRDLLEQKREMNESKDKESKVFHKTSIASSASFESDQTDGYLSSSEQHTSISSLTTSEHSSSFTSTIESDVFPESGPANADNNRGIYNPISESMKSNTSITSENQSNGECDSVVHSGSSLGLILSSMHGNSLPNEEWQDVSTKPKVNTRSPVASKLQTVPGDSADSSDSRLVGKSDVTCNGSPDESNLLSLDDRAIPKDPGVSHEGTVTELETKVNDTRPEDANADVIDFKNNVTDIKSDITNDVTDSKSDITDDGTDSKFDIANDVTDSKSDIADGVTDSKFDITDDVNDSKSDIADGVTDGKFDITDDVTDSKSDITDGVTDSNPDITDGVTDTKSDITNDVTDTKSDITDDVTDSKFDITNGVIDSDPDITNDVTNATISEIADDQPNHPGDFQFTDIAFSDSSSSSFPSRSSTFCSQSSTADQQPLSDISSVTHTNDEHTAMKMEDFSSTGCEGVGCESCSQTGDVETELCTLCKENTPVDQLVTIPLDVAELIEKRVLQCWRSGIFLNHPHLFLVVSYRPLSDAVVVETAVSPSPIGRRLLTFVVDHLDTLIKEWYPGLLMSYGAEPTVQKLIPCRNCEKSGIPRPHKFTFDSCVTQYSMGDYVRCPRHEVSIQDIAPDVVLNDIDTSLLLDEHEIVYEKTEANKLGDGNFGKVYRGLCRGKEAAIKEYSTPSTEKDALQRYCEVRKELNVLRRVGQHPFLVNLIGVCLRPFRLVLELAVEGSLAKTLFDRAFPIERVVIYRMVYQVADALGFLHSLKVIYRDLKPENVLVLSYDERADVNIKVTDFGTATFQFSEGLLALEGTPGYHAPEMLEEFSKRKGYDEKVDVFSLAMLIYGFITREKPFYNFSSSADVNNAVSSGRKPEYSDVIVARIGLASLTWLMEECMQFDPSARPSANAVASQVRSPPFQLLLGVVALPCPQSVRHVCVVEATRELWVAVDDKATNKVLVYELDRMCLKKKFTVNRILTEDLPLCMQVNCMHVSATAVLIGLRGDLDVVTLHDLVTYDITAKITLPEPVFCLSSNHQYIFLGMSSGVFRVVPTATDGSPQTIEVSNTQPISCMVATDKFLWLTVAKCIHIFHTEEDEGMCAFELNAVRFSSSHSPCSHAVLSPDRTAVWCVSKGDSIATGWDVAKKEKICEINCRSVLREISCDDKPLSPIEVSVTCVLPVLDTVWVGTGGGILLILDAQSGELITWIKLLDDHVRTLTLVSWPGPCATERCFVVASGKNVLETALCRGGGKVVCRLRQEMFKQAPDAAPSPTKTGNKTRNKNKFSVRTKSPLLRSDTEDGRGADLPISGGGQLLFFEALPAAVLRRIEAKSTPLMKM